MMWREKQLPIAQFAARSKDPLILQLSSSGGVFTELARVILGQKGVIVGVGWGPDTLRAVHKCVESETELAALRGSKYVVSDMSDVYAQIRNFLKEERKVLFVGTPCQVAAIRCVFGVNPSLFCCAVMCHSNINNAVWRKYLEDVEKRHDSRVTDVRFRDKRLGWHNGSTIFFFAKQSKNLIMPWCETLYGKLFLSGWAAQEACLKCQFRAGRSRADLQIGDFWGIEDVCKPFDDDKGVSAVLIYTEKGMELFGASACIRQPVEYVQVIARNPYIEVSPIVDLKKRARFLSAYNRMSFSHALRYAEFGPLHVELITRLRRAIYAFIKRLV